MRTPALLLILAVLPACSAPQTATWPTGWSYGWEGFNHRLSYAGYALTDTEASVAIVGGTSTTGIRPPLDDSCDPDTCKEYRAVDHANVQVDWARVTTRKATFGRATAQLVADAAGDSQTLTVPFDRHARGQVTAWITGFTIDTDHALSGGPACYDPASGWNPTHMAIQLDNAALASDGQSATVDVSAIFEAGKTLEDARQCIDAVNDQALVPISVDVLVVAGNFEVATYPVSDSMSYTYGCTGIPCTEPDPQPDPDLSQRPLVLDPAGAAAGWSAFDFRFHVDDPDDRGAYLRTFQVGFDASAGWASGHATNYSRVTQLSGFDYAFTGQIDAVDLGVDVEYGSVSDRIDVKLDDAGHPVFSTLPL